MIDQTFSAKGWIYNLADYRQIFGFIDTELPKKVLDYPAGISSVNAELYAQGKRIVSCDPAYHFSTQQMQQHAQQILQHNIQHLQQHQNILSNNQAIDEIIQRWRHSTEVFLADYATGKQQGRYRIIELPPAPEPDGAFELLFCTDLLFNSSVRALYSPQNLINALIGLATDVRIFPLSDEKNVIAGELGPILLAFQQQNFGVEIRAVNSSQRRDANAMLRIWAKECVV
jgi:hypothetical protein